MKRDLLAAGLLSEEKWCDGVNHLYYYSTAIESTAIWWFYQGAKKIVGG